MLLDGRALSKSLNGALKRQVDALERKPGLAVIQVGDDPASAIYVRRKGEVGRRIGFVIEQIRLPADTDEATLIEAVEALNAAAHIDGILVQLPLPAHLSTQRVIERIDPEKDVDGLTTTSIGRLAQGRPSMVSCTPAGVMVLLAQAGIPLDGARATVLGRSNIVGRPMAMLLEQANCTVTVCHSRTRDLEAILATSDIVVAAIGRPEHVRGAWIKPGAIVVDVGINRLEDGSLAGDVEFEAANARASAITPVPGGVGPMTIAMLMQNTYQAAVARGTDSVKVRPSEEGKR